MLFAEAIRLAAIEILCPTGATSHPTLAGALVFDSRAPAVQDLNGMKPYTPTLALYTTQATAGLRAEPAAVWDTDASCVLDVVAELTVVSSEDGNSVTEAMAEGDPEARLVLAALNAQVRYHLERSLAGGAFRRIVRAITGITSQTMAVPELGLRLHQTTTRFTIACRDDIFDPQAGGLPEPIASIAEALPTGSYAKAKLNELGQHFPPIGAPALSGVAISTTPITSGL